MGYSIDSMRLCTKHGYVDFYFVRLILLRIISAGSRQPRFRDSSNIIRWCQVFALSMPYFADDERTGLFPPARLMKCLFSCFLKTPLTLARHQRWPTVAPMAQSQNKETHQLCVSVETSTSALPAFLVHVFMRQCQATSSTSSMTAARRSRRGVQSPDNWSGRIFPDCA
jgi:hypothetical protein